MGQIFNACAYDVDNRVCCTVYADKFHANCYSYSGAVASMHYLLRQKPYHIMWGGGYVVIDDYLENISNEDILLGISTYEDFEEFKCNNDDIEKLSYYEKIKFIDDNSKTWKHKSVWDEALEYFDLKNTYCVNYDGFLVNHTKKQAINLKEYFDASKYIVRGGIETAIDLIPMLTETGGGTEMALFEGITADSTEYLAGRWCGDLLQIVEECLDGYELMECCISQSTDKMKYCYIKYGTNQDGYVLKNEDGDLFRAFNCNPFTRSGRGPEHYIKTQVTRDEIRFSAVEIEEEDDYQKAYQQAFEQGYQEGVQKVIEEAVINLQKSEINISTIAGYVGISEQEVQDIIERHAK